ncbi:MAG: lipid A biosynthesis lauroyl acyltransferase [Notoacmeibacter sp.]
MFLAKLYCAFQAESKMSGTKLRLLAIFRDGIDWVKAKLIFGILAVLKLLPAEMALRALSWMARKIGPLFGRNRVALNNLNLAMPGLSDAQKKAIASDMWENMARLAGEYVFLDELFDYDPAAPSASRIEIEGEALFQRLREDPKPKIFFTAHMGNFELLPIAAATFGLNVTALFRPPNNKYIADRILSARQTRMGHLVPSKAGASITLARVLEAGGNIGVLVDQKFINGLETTFFDQPCLTSPLLAKLARQYDCDIYPAFCIRLPNGKFRLTLEDKIDVPRNEKGQIDQRALMQAINNRVEIWVRAFPGQWTWFHKRWQISQSAKPRG